MKIFLVSTSALLFCLLAPVTPAQAACSGDNPDHAVVYSISISPNVIAGDGSQLAVATVQGCVPDGANNGLVTQLQAHNLSGTVTICDGGSLNGSGCTWPNVGTGDVTVTFEFNGINYSQDDEDASYDADAYGYPPMVSAPFVVQAAGADPDPGPDGPCSSCAGNPINVTNGDTWITQHDYSNPGLAGGLSLTRTWNSLWPRLNPPEESGIFGDSWRSNFEERIQLVGSTAYYWKGNGSQLVYAYDALDEAYSLIEPLDDQTTLVFDQNVWVVTQKDGTKRIFSQAGYLTSIVDRNGNTTTINIDPDNQNRISSVVDAVGRVLTFNYGNPNFPRLCTGISDALGTFTQYQYDSAGRLVQVLYPDGSQYNFQYNDPNSNTLISLVADVQGKTIRGPYL